MKRKGVPFPLTSMSAFSTSNLESFYSLDSFYKELKLRERIEDVVCQLTTEFSQLHTLNHSYKVFINSHKSWLTSNLSNKLPEYDAESEKDFSEIRMIFERLKPEKDVIVLHELATSLRERIRSRKDNMSAEEKVLITTSAVKKKNEHVLKVVQQHTEEMCLRLLYAAETLRESKKSFSRKIEQTTRKAKEDLANLAVKKFQIIRLEKLRLHLAEVKAKTEEVGRQRMRKYSEFLEKLRISNNRLLALESERNRLSLEKRQLPIENRNAMEDLQQKNDKLKITISSLEVKLRYLEQQTSQTLEGVEKEKLQLARERSTLQAQLALTRASFCKAVKKAELRKVPLPPFDIPICTD